MIDKRRSVVPLIAGGCLLLVASFALSMAWSGVSELRELGNQEAAEEKEKTHIDLNVPGTTTALLRPQSYSIWLQGHVDRGNNERHGGLRAEDLPAVDWDISGPSPVTISHQMQIRVNDYRLAGTFLIEQEGDYTFTTTVPDESEPSEHVYNIGDDPTAIVGEVAGTVVHGVGQALKVAVAGAIGALSCIAGTTLIVVFCLRLRSNATVSNHNLND